MTMKGQSKQLAVMAVTLLLVVAGCSPSAAALPPTQLPPTPMPPTANPISATVLGMVERMNAGDLDGVMAYWADDAIVYFFGLPPTGTEIYKGKGQIRPVFEECIGSHFKWAVEISSVVGDVVNAQAKTWHDFTRQLEVAPLEYTDVYVVKDGKIVAYTSTITEESLSRFKPALAKMMPAEPPATPSSEKPVSDLSITISGGTCNYGGPMTLQAGEIKVTWEVKDQDRDLYALTFFGLAPDKDLTDLMAATVSSAPPSWSNMLLYKELGPGKSQTYSFTVKEGPVYLVCWSKPPDLPIGGLGPFVVKK
jgi:ketosteroid isomerase-like protein